MTCCSAARRMQPPNQLHRSCVHKLHGSKVMPEPIDTRHCSPPGDVMLCDEGCKVDAKIAPGLWAPHRDRHCFDTSRCIKHERFLAWDFPAHAGLPAHLAPSKFAPSLDVKALTCPGACYAQSTFKPNANCKQLQTAGASAGTSRSAQKQKAIQEQTPRIFATWAAPRPEPHRFPAPPSDPLPDHHWNTVTSDAQSSQTAALPKCMLALC
jgi:hypothetical protein